MRNTLVVIPARMGSTRFPGKVLEDLGGMSVVQRCWMAAKAAGFPVAVATESREVERAVKSFGGEAVLTSSRCRSGTDRVRQAVDGLERGKPRRFARVLNLQGDEPFILPATIRKVAGLLDSPGAQLATAVVPLDDPGRAAEPSVVKAVLARDGRCLYFSRSRVPFGEAPLFQHIGIYGFTREALERFVSLRPSPLERSERLEQLRALEAGMTIRAAIVRHVPIAIDTPEDLRRAKRLLKKIKLRRVTANGKSVNDLMSCASSLREDLRYG